VGDFGRRPAFELDLFLGKAALIENDDALVLEPDDVVRL
jgi:hypothetical protein